jgi:hypothetical protein
MRGHQVRTALCFGAAAALLAFASCNDSSPAPTPIRAPGSNTTSPAVVSLRLDSPNALAPGATAQLTATALRSDGSSEVLRSGVQWLSTNTRVLRVDSQGLASALVVGESRVTVSGNGRSASSSIFVVPDGTFRLQGQIVEGGAPVDGASITVIGGTGDGLSTTTSASGGYALYGVAGSIRLHIKKTGYQNLIQDLQVSGHSTHNMTMVLERPRESLAGSYQLQLTATGCGSIPSELQQRTYDARVEQDGARLTVTLSGADFIVSNGTGNYFTGTYSPDGRIVFSLFNFDYYYYYWYAPPSGIVERVSPTSALIINGSANTTQDGRGTIAGSLSGLFATSARLISPFWPHTASCNSPAHRIELRKR